MTKFLSVAILLVSSLLVSCTQNEPSRGADQKAAAAIPNWTDEERIHERVTARWDAVIKNDVVGMYSFASPAYRSVYSVGQFSTRYGAQVERTRIDITSIEVHRGEGPPTATVKLLLYFNLPGLDTEKPIETNSGVTERWIKANGEWWRVEQG